MKNKVKYLSVAFFIFVCFTIPRIMSENGLDFGWKKCFNTPGLFDKSGKDFILAYLFELPLAVLRWNSHMGMVPVIILILAVSVIASKKKGKKNV